MTGPGDPATDAALAAAAAHHRAGRVADAERGYRQVLQRDPARAQAVVMLGTLLLQGGRLGEATALFRDDARRKPDDVGAHLALVSLLDAQGAADEAGDVLRHVVRIAPTHALALARLGHLERARGDLDAALAWFARAVDAAPAHGEARNDFGRTLVDAGRPHEGLLQLQQAARLDPGRAEVRYNVGNALQALGRTDEAVDAYRHAVRIDPTFGSAHNNLGAALKSLSRLDEAAAAFEIAVRLQPDAAGPLTNLAGVREWQARHDDALALHRRAMALAPAAADVHGNYLFTLLFHPAYDAAALRREHDAWNTRHAAPLAAAARPHGNDATPDRRLRVGYLGGLFRDHVVGRNLMPLLREHDRSAVELFCYSTNRIDDAMTDRFRALADGWRDIGRLSDDAVAAQIRHDRIDLLVDTTVHLEGNRLTVFARRPAPVQVTFAGYPGSTGMPAVDWRLTDVHLDPPGEHDDWYAERSWRLPDSFWCYDPLGEDVPVGPPPADANGFVTFGCLNNFSKVNDAVLSLWSAVLAAAPGSRLLLLCHDGGHRARTLDTFGRLGVAADRIEFAGYRPRRDYLALFGRIDVSLDTVPYNGHTTGLDSLWMGVPVVTLVGRTVAGRAGLGQLSNLGLHSLVADTPGAYVATAAALAADRGRLRSLRRTLRALMTASPLMDAPAFARHIEAAYRGMWQQWGATRSA